MTKIYCVNNAVINAEITKLPIVIVANYRTGSSQLGKQLARRYQVEWFPEPYEHSTVRNSLEEHYQNNNYVTKFIVDQIPNLDLHRRVLEQDCFKICLTRENKLEQIVSYYIAKHKNVWKQTVQNLDSYLVPIDPALMISLIDRIHNNDRLLAESNIEFNLSCTYESLDFGNIVDLGTYKTTQPDNLDEIKELAQQLM